MIQIDGNRMSNVSSPKVECANCKMFFYERSALDGHYPPPP